MAEPLTRADAVRNLQRYLRRISMEDNNVLPVPVDGIFASRTTEALAEFQRMSDLPVTGRADKRTWDTLFREYVRLTRALDQRDAPEFFPTSPFRYQTTSGERSSFIKLLQWILTELSVAYDTLSPPDISGIMDEETSRSVSEFQRIQGLPQSGQVDRNTWNRLSTEFNQYLT